MPRFELTVEDRAKLDAVEILLKEIVGAERPARKGVFRAAANLAGSKVGILVLTAILTSALTLFSSFEIERAKQRDFAHREEGARVRALEQNRQRVAQEIDRRIAFLGYVLHQRVNPASDYKITADTSGAYKREIQTAFDAVFAPSGYFFVDPSTKGQTFVQLYGELLTYNATSREMSNAWLTVLQLQLAQQLRSGSLNINFDHPKELALGMCKHWLPFREHLKQKSVLEGPEITAFCKPIVSPEKK